MPGLSRQLHVFTVLDLDRTILKSTRFFEGYVLPAIEAYYGNSADNTVVAKCIDTVRQQEQQRRGQAFDFIAAFDEVAQSRALPSLDSAQLAEQVLRANRRDDGEFINDIIASGGIELVRALQAEPESAWAFYTTGGQQTQTLKLRVMQAIFDIYETTPMRWQIIATEHKARDIARNWYDKTTGLFRVPEALAGEPAQAQRIRVIDDKTANVALEEGIEGGSMIEAVLVHRAESADETGVALHEVAQKIRQTYEI